MKTIKPKNKSKKSTPKQSAGLNRLTYIQTQLASEHPVRQAFRKEALAAIAPIATKYGFSVKNSISLCFPQDKDGSQCKLEVFLDRKGPKLTMPKVNWVVCQFTSEWDSEEITTRARYDEDTGKVEVLETEDGPEDGILEREYITLPDGTDIDVCTDCHEYIKVTDGVRDRENELSYLCKNPECEGA